MFTVNMTPAACWLYKLYLLSTKNTEWATHLNTVSHFFPLQSENEIATSACKWLVHPLRASSHLHWLKTGHITLLVSRGQLSLYTPIPEHTCSYAHIPALITCFLCLYVLLEIVKSSYYRFHQGRDEKNSQHLIKAQQYIIYNQFFTLWATDRGNCKTYILPSARKVMFIPAFIVLKLWQDVHILVRGDSLLVKIGSLVTLQKIPKMLENPFLSSLVRF